MKTLGAYIIVRNESDVLPGCVHHLIDHVDELLLVDHGSTDGTDLLIDQLAAENPECVKSMRVPHVEPIDMGALRTMCYQAMKSDWVMNVDADEYYPAQSMRVIRDAIEKADKEISFRVPYFNLAWRPGYIQDAFDHYPDRIYRRDTVDAVKGLLPNDMHHVKPGFYKYNPIIEYDNASDISFENPVQPILRNAPYYHLARTRGYWFEYTKWFRYNKNLHPMEPDYAIETSTRINQWVSGLYSIKKIDVPPGIPLQNIKQAKVSVIIPNHNYGQFVAEAIQSALHQTYPVHEIVVVDDASTDNSLEVIKFWASKYPQIKVVEHQENKGVATARNGGVAVSTGDYFVCLDADDRLAPTFVQECLKRMTGDIQVVYTDMKVFGADNYQLQMPEFSSEELKKNQIIPSACALIDRHVFELCGGFDPSEWYEDYGWWLRIDKNGFNFAQVHEPLFEYRKHGPSRITMLDEKQAAGFEQLRERYGKIVS